MFEMRQRHLYLLVSRVVIICIFMETHVCKNSYISHAFNLLCIRRSRTHPPFSGTRSLTRTCHWFFLAPLCPSFYHRCLLSLPSRRPPLKPRLPPLPIACLQVVAFLAKRDDAAALKEYASFEDRFEVAFIAKRAAEARAAEEAEAERMRELVAAQVGQGVEWGGQSRGLSLTAIISSSFTFSFSPVVYHVQSVISHPPSLSLSLSLLT